MKKYLVFVSLIPLIFLSVLNVFPQDTQGVVGIWLGTLRAGAIEVRLVFHISTQPDKTLKALMDSPDQGAKGIEMDAAVFVENTLTLELKKAGILYTAKLSADGSELDGEFQQGGLKTKMPMKRIKEAPSIIRPQDPKKPYPYVEEDVVYENTRDKVKLAATLTLPQGNGPFPAVILITGSGAQNRNEEVMGHRPFLVLADHLTRKGIAVLRADDRGVGGSTGNISDSTSENFAYDALAGIEFLKSRKEIDVKKIGLIGHSEGGIIAPLAASLSKDVAFIVMMAGTGLTGEDILYLQGALISRAMGVSEEKIKENTDLQKRIFSVLKSQKDEASIKKELSSLFEESYEKMTDEEKKAITDKNTYLEGQFKSLLSPWFRFFLTYDPKSALGKVTCPVLAINGEKDLQVPPQENLPVIEQTLKQSGNRDVTVQMLPGLNHLFQKSATGAVSEYPQIPETINPAALTAISGWITERVQNIK
jgi:pimeloyl-ACP methyl ester carboxylesterase